jgi:O-antigen/teichoic acid export membrane protein
LSSLAEHVRRSSVWRALASARAGRWFLTVAEFMAVQALVQLLTAVTGLLTVRWLDKADYALYTIAVTWTGAFIALSNSGIGSAATALGGRVWDDRVRLGSVIASALRMRRWLAATTIVPVSAMLIWTLIQNGADTATLLTIVILVAGSAGIQLTYSILLVVLRLRGAVRRIQLVESVGGLSRLLLTATVAFVYFNGVVALAISLAAVLLQYAMVRHAVSSSIDLHAAPDAEATRRIRQVVGRQWLNEVNGVFLGQISIILLSFFGTAAAVADLGALSRIGVIFAIFGATVQSILLPRYARCQEPARLRQLYGRIVAAYTALAMSPALLAWAWPEPFLWLLGPRYAGLAFEFQLLTVNVGIYSIAATTWGLNMARAWVIPGWMLVPATIALQLLLMAVIGVTTVPQVLYIGIISNAAYCVINIVGASVFMRGSSGR